MKKCIEVKQFDRQTSHQRWRGSATFADVYGQ